jgi:hypothetical protein
MEKKVHKEVKNQSMGYIAGALGLVAGLAWNDAIKALIDFFFPLDKSGLGIKFIYAILVTIVVVVLTNYILSPSSEQGE